ncbi:ABC transporter ATP-binding protein [Olsenella uli]|uniref:ABC transporter ATP-binding protein n=1 Tax=Olsenella uli TaxID=133926 RepID=UPI0024A83FE6|nr:ABC transporter ATP-binding protein [Olsenella uli]
MSNAGQSAASILMGFARPCKGMLAESVALAVLGALCGMVPYIAASRGIIMVCRGDYDFGGFALLAGIALVGYLGQVWLGTFSTMRSHEAAFTILGNIRTAIAGKLSRVPMGTILDTPSGTFKTIAVDTVEKLELPLAHMVPELTANTLIPAMMLAYLFVLDWRIALISLATIPVGIFCYMGMLKDYERRYARVLTAGKRMDAATVEYIGGIEVVKTFNQGDRSYKKYADAVAENRASKETWFRQTNGYYVVGLSILTATLTGVLPLGSWLFMNGSIGAGTFITCIVLALGLVKPLIQALQYTDSLAMVDSTVKEVKALLDLPELSRPDKAVPLVDTHVSFEDVTFRYEGAPSGDGGGDGSERDGTEVLHGVSFDCAKGGMTAIVGPSGSGKSTIARLIASFWEAERGFVRIGGVDVRKMPLSQVMELVSYVSQDNFLFHLSVRENIRIGKPDATDAEVEDAARKASCHDFILSLPKGYDTLAGDAGSHLSGGERQRIAIARAILKNSPIVVLDEATAFTDPENEAAIQASIAKLVAGKTLIVIAHRLSTIVDADKILVIDRGRVAAEGTHEELVAESPLYGQLWNAHVASRDTAKEVA